VGFDVEIVMHSKTVLTICDVGGRTKIHAYLRHYLQNTQGLTYVVDSHDSARLTRAMEEMWRISVE
jgi:ADP-ribosylation factor 1/2